MMRALLPLSLVLVLGGGCNSVLGIDEAKVDPSLSDAQSYDSSQDSSWEGSTGQDAASQDGYESSTNPQCQASGAPCWDCTASRCCDVYSDCLGDTACQNALDSYNSCLQNPPDSGATCAELASGSSSKFLILSNCVLIQRCFTACHDYPLGDQCKDYCACMQSTCPSETFPAGSCAQQCTTFSAAQIECRTLHCTFAQGDPTTHCPHAAGHDVCP